MSAATVEWHPSRYNFCLPEEGGAILFNTRTAACMRLHGPDAGNVARALTSTQASIPQNVFDDHVVKTLEHAGFLIPSDFDELEVIRQRFQRARNDTPMVLTLTTTMDCNLGCYYCYEQRSSQHLSYADLPAILDLVKRKLQASRKNTFHVDWYGGEPMLNVGFMEQASQALQELSDSLNVRYTASIISNGTSWPSDIAAFVQRHRITEVQISFDGLEDNHTRRRHLRHGYRAIAETSTFQQAVETVDVLLDHVRVDIRLNIDRGNLKDVRPFIQWARARGWFSRTYPAVIQPARLAAYSASSEFMRQTELSVHEFNEIQASIRKEVSGFATLEEAETPDGFPYPRTSVCAALANDSVVIGADGLQYRCGLQVGETHRAVDYLETKPRKTLPMYHDSSATVRADSEWWNAFDPTNLPNCKRCSFLPICWGGCPKRHLEKDQHALAEQGNYWRTNLARMIATMVDSTVTEPFSYTEQDQFRP